MKDEWKNYLDSLPMQVTKLHKEEFKRWYRPENMELPVVLVSDGRQIQVLLTAEEINQYHSSESLLTKLKNTLEIR